MYSMCNNKQKHTLAISIINSIDIVVNIALNIPMSNSSDLKCKYTRLQGLERCTRIRKAV